MPYFVLSLFSLIISSIRHKSTARPIYHTEGNFIGIPPTACSRPPDIRRTRPLCLFPLVSRHPATWAKSCRIVSHCVPFFCEPMCRHRSSPFAIQLLFRRDVRLVWRTRNFYPGQCIQRSAPRCLAVWLSLCVVLPVFTGIRRPHACRRYHDYIIVGFRAHDCGRFIIIIAGCSVCACATTHG